MPLNKILGYFLPLYELVRHRNWQDAEHVYPGIEDQLIGEEIVLIHDSKYLAQQRMTPAGDFYVAVRLLKKEDRNGDDKVVRDFGQVKPADESDLVKMIKSTQLKGEVRF